MSRNASGCRSCLLWLACLSLGLALVVGIAAYVGYRKARSFLDQFAQAKPLALPAVAYSPVDVTNIHARIGQFLDRARTGETNARLALDARDLNVLLSAAGFSNRVHVTLRSNAVAGQFSVPLQDLGMPLFHGRYLNGAGILDVGCASGTLKVTLRELGVNGRSVPEHYMEYIRRQNFAREVGTNAPTRESLERIGCVAVENERLVFEVGPAK